MLRRSPSHKGLVVLTEVPDDWQLLTVSECMSAIIDYRGKSPQKTTFGVPLITAKIVKRGRIADPSEYIAQEDYDDWMRRGIPQPGDVVITTEAPLGEVAQLDTRTVALAQRLITLRGSESILDNTFLKFAMQSAFVQDQLRARATGTTVLGIRQSELRKIDLPIPPLDEQRAIAGVLGSLDDKIELNRRMNRTLEQMAAAIFRAWFVDFEPVRAKAAGATRFPTMPQEVFDALPTEFNDSLLGPIPSGWEVGTLGRLCDKPQYGYTASASTEPVGPKFLRITDINKQPWIDWETVPFCQATRGDFEKYRLMAGDLLVARMADPGHGVLIEETVKGIFASYLIRFRPLHTAYARYLQYWLRSSDYWGLVKGRQSGTTRANLNAKVLSAFPLVVPPPRAADAFGVLAEAFRNKVVANVKESNTLAAIRDVLLPKLLSGEIRVVAAEKLVEEVA